MNNNMILKLEQITKNYPCLTRPACLACPACPDVKNIISSYPLDDKDITLMNKNELSEVRNKKIGFVFQLHHLLPQCSVIENVLLPSLPFPRENSDKVHEYGVQMLERVGLQEHLHHRPGQLSVGEQQRAAVVRALINKPDILLADEPTGSLDNNSAENLINLLVELNKEYNLTLLMVTHAVDLAKKMKKVYSLHNGTLKELK